MSKPEFARVVEEGVALQQRFAALQLVAVGGTAAALHCQHRISLDVDEVSPHLQEKFSETVGALKNWPGWTTNRLNPPVLILGARHGVELGLRQQRRSVPLHTTTVAGLLIPTAKEMLRVKAWLLVERRATRDYVDVAALAGHLGRPDSLAALTFLNAVYPVSSPQSLATRFAEICEGEPVDLATVPLPGYKGLRPPLTDWPYVATVCRELGRELLKLELTGALPESPGEPFENETEA